MMGAIFNGSNTVLSTPNHLVGSTPTYPVLLGSWVKLANLTANHCVVGLYENATSNMDEIVLAISSNLASDPTRALASEAGASSAAVLNGASSGVWQFNAALLTSASSRQAIRGSTFGTAETTTRNTTGLTAAAVGAVYRASAGVATTFLNGRAAEVFIASGFNIANINTIINALAAGTRPINVTDLSSSINAYQPLRAGLNDSGYVGPNWTNSNVTFDVADHPINYFNASWARNSNVMVRV